MAFSHGWIYFDHFVVIDEAQPSARFTELDEDGYTPSIAWTSSRSKRAIILDDRVGIGGLPSWDSKLGSAFDRHPIMNAALVSYAPGNQDRESFYADYRVDMIGNVLYSEITWNNPGLVNATASGSSLVNSADAAGYKSRFPLSVDDAELINAISNGAYRIELGSALQGDFGLYGVGDYEAGSFGVYMDVYYDPAETVYSQVRTVRGAQSGWLNRFESNTFACDLTYGGAYPAFGVPKAFASAVFHWRAGLSGDWTDLSMNLSGLNRQAVRTVGADTFPGGTVQWYVSAVDAEGHASQTPVYTLTTTDSTAYATPVSPVETVEDGSAAIPFSWSVANDSGSTPTGADLQYSRDGAAWSTLASVSGSARSLMVPAGTFESGQVYWRVRAYNADGVAGDWSAAASFVAVGAPPALTVSCDGRPFATVSWQSKGQQAWRVTVDSTVYGPFFGTGKNFTLPDYLTDGQHTASVEVQNEYGLWSAPGTVSFTVANVPGDAITLSGSFGVDAALGWETASATADFTIYRDGVRIGHTAARSFTDRLSLGSHSYFVINKLAGGYYTKSNDVTGTTAVRSPVIAALSGGEWVSLRLSRQSARTVDWSRSVVNHLYHVAGSVFPVQETTPWRNESLSDSVSFLSPAESEPFETLLGRAVICKYPGRLLIGALSAVQLNMGRFSDDWGFTVTACAWEDYVDETGS